MTIETHSGKNESTALRPTSRRLARVPMDRCAPNSSAHRENDRSSAPATRILAIPFRIWNVRLDRRFWSFAIRRWKRSCIRFTTAMSTPGTTRHPSPARPSFQSYQSDCPRWKTRKTLWTRMVFTVRETVSRRRKTPNALFARSPAVVSRKNVTGRRRIRSQRPAETSWSTTVSARRKAAPFARCSSPVDSATETRIAKSWSIRPRSACGMTSPKMTRLSSGGTSPRVARATAVANRNAMSRPVPLSPKRRRSRPLSDAAGRGR